MTEQTTQSIQSRAQNLKKGYFFRFNPESTEKLSHLTNLIVRTVHPIKDRIIFNTSSPDRRNKKILITDYDFNVMQEIDTSTIYPFAISNIEPFEDFYIVSGTMLDNNIQYDSYLFSKEFEQRGHLGDYIAFFKGKNIISVAPDTKGGMYFCEATTGMLHYMNSDRKISSFKGAFQLPFQIAYFNDTLWICDLLQSLHLQKTNNVIEFKDNQFRSAGITADTLSFSPELNCFFAISGTLENCVKKYSLDKSLIFEKHFSFDDPPLNCTLGKTTGNNLLVLSRNYPTPRAYTIF